MAFDPPLGSTSPAVLLDNATRLDELVNGPAGTVNDRAGQPLDTWRQIMAMVAAAIIEAQNSITAIGLPFTDEAEVQAAAD
ncbi:TPA: GDSL family lipase, partial [Klebsiella pneumoniae]|nr:GDSL family lipase [Klebsiella pneumoniae]